MTVFGVKDFLLIEISEQRHILIIMFITLVFVVVIFQLLARHMTKNVIGLESDVNTKKQLIYGLDVIPHVKPEFPFKFIGNFHLLLPYKNTLSNILIWCQEYGELVKFSGVNQTFVILNSAPLVQTALKSGNLGHVTKSPLVYDTMQPFITNGVLVSKGCFWQGQRKILLRTQSFVNLKAYMKMLNSHAKNMTAELKELFGDGKKPRQINVLLNSTFLKVISELITGFDVSGSTEFDEYHHNFQTWKKAVLKRIFRPWLLYQPIWRWHPLKNKHDKAVKEMVAFARRRVEEHKTMRAGQLLSAENNANVNKQVSFRSVLDELIDEEVDEDQIVDEVNTMLFGGHETGATAIHFFCLSMALNQDIQKKCREDIDNIFENASETDGTLSYENVHGELKYLERCIMETLRLFPSVFLFLRQIQVPLTLDYKDKPVELPSGTNVVVLPYTLHRNPEYFKEPNKFDPDRFLPENSVLRHSYSYLPFSGGPRNCLAMKFAMMEMKVIAAYILRHFEISTTDQIDDIPLLPFITLTPAKDYTFQFKKRFYPQT